VIEGQAPNCCAGRRLLAAESVLILADVLVKHRVSLHRWHGRSRGRMYSSVGGADGVIVSGVGTGQPPPAVIWAGRRRRPGAPPC